jgi:UDP-N-acetylmuramate dehydrogenase
MTVKTIPPFAIRDRVPLAELCTIGIGGAARHLCEASDPAHLREALAWAAARSIPLFVLGGGSNVLFPDTEYPGLVVRMAMTGMRFRKSASGVIARAAAGVDWDAFVAAAVERGLQGVECLSGIPGSVGATPIQNVGAYGQEVADTIVGVEALDRRTGAEVEIPARDCDFGYRTSKFKFRERNHYIVTAVKFRLVPGGEPTLRYGDLTRQFDEARIANPTLQQVRDAVITIRRAKAMVVDPDEPSSRSCGSFFINPVVECDEVSQVRARGGVAPDEAMPAHATPDGRMKLSAAWLIEHAGFRRGQRHGGAGISEKHVLAIVNYGGATAREVLELAAAIQRGVRDKFGVRLETEPVLPAL